MGYSSLENAAFELNHPKWGKILIVCNEFAPRDEVLVWTRELISNDKYKNYKVIYLTHSFLFQRSAQNKFLKRRKLLMHWEILIMVRIYRKNSLPQRHILKKFVEPSKNIMLVVCGHTGTKVHTYSPLFGISPATKHLAHRTELIDQFEMVAPEWLGNNRH